MSGLKIDTAPKLTPTKSSFKHVSTCQDEGLSQSFLIQELHWCCSTKIGVSLSTHFRLFSSSSIIDPSDVHFISGDGSSPGSDASGISRDSIAVPAPCTGEKSPTAQLLGQDLPLIPAFYKKERF